MREKEEEEEEEEERIYRMRGRSPPREEDNTHACTHLVVCQIKRLEKPHVVEARRNAYKSIADHRQTVNLFDLCKLSRQGRAHVIIQV